MTTLLFVDASVLSLLLLKKKSLLSHDFTKSTLIKLVHSTTDNKKREKKSTHTNDQKKLLTKFSKYQREREREREREDEDEEEEDKR